MDTTQSILTNNEYKKTSIVPGGTTRHRSIAAGVRALDNLFPSGEGPDVVVVHDAVRPLIPIPTLTEVVLAAKKYGAAGPIRPLVSTVVCCDSERFLDQALDRSRYMASEMPQAFQYAHLISAYENCTEQEYLFGTECLQLILKYCNVRAKLIEGPADLWKVTYKKDVYAIDRLIKECNSRAKISVEGEFDQQLLDKFVQALSKKVTVIDGNQLHMTVESPILQVEVVFHVRQTLSHVENWCLQQVDGEMMQCQAKNVSVHIMLHESYKEEQPAFSDVNRLTEKMKAYGKRLYFIWQSEKNFDDAGLERLVELVTIFVVEKHSCLSGQLFIFP